MFKAIKDNKIIAINDTGKFPCLVYDEVIEDTEHTCEDYKHYDGEFTLHNIEKDNEEAKQARANAYAVEVDPLHSRKQRKLILGEWTEDDETEYVLKIKELSDKIEREFPYGEEIE